jgi:hypothetical protein
MGILTVGLLGVASVFPVGGWYMQRAEIADRGSAIAQSVMSQLVTTGLLDPRSWFSITPSPTSNTVGDPDYLIPAVDGKYLSPPGPAVPSFTRPVSEALRFAQQNNLSATTRSAMIGNAFVIDPIGAAAIVSPQGKNNNYTANYAFPSSAYVDFPGASTYYYYSPQWKMWTTSAAGGKPKAMTWPVRRVTFRDPSTGFNIGKALAENVCMVQDDLTYSSPQRDDRPALAPWDTNQDSTSGSTFPAARQWVGDYSWIATVMPTTMGALDSLAASPNSFEFVVSVVVFYKRGIPGVILGSGGTALIQAMQSERSVGAKIISTSQNGGEVLLWDFQDNPSEGAFTNLKVGQWIMLCGPHPSSNDQSPKFSLSWYKVLTIESEASSVITDPVHQRLVTLRGGAWPWQPRLSYPSAQQSSDVAKLSDDLCVGIFKGAVAVHTRTLRLENLNSAGLFPVGMSGGVSNDSKAHTD